MLDFLLVFNLTLSLLVVLLSIFLTRATDFLVFPVLLLLLTIFRLALNIASTRMILLEPRAPDVILAFTIKPVIYAGISARLMGLPMVQTITGLGTVFIRSTWVTRLAKIMYRVALGKSEKVFLLYTPYEAPSTPASLILLLKFLFYQILLN